MLSTSATSVSFKKRGGGTRASVPARRPGAAAPSTARRAGRCLWTALLPPGDGVGQDGASQHVVRLCLRSSVSGSGGPVSDLPTPGVARLPRARWLDARLLIGLLLVLLSVVVGAKVFAEADERVAVWAVTRDLGADTTLASGDLVARSVRLDQAAGRYVSADQSLDGLVLRRAVGKDELLPVAALGEPGAADQRRVGIED